MERRLSGGEGGVLMSGTSAETAGAIQDSMHFVAARRQMLAVDSNPWTGSEAEQIPTHPLP